VDFVAEVIKASKECLPLKLISPFSAREYAYGPESKVDTFSDALMAEAKQRGWAVISMKRDWKRIFAWQQEGPAS
jgi:hypothetical protein